MQGKGLGFPTSGGNSSNNNNNTQYRADTSKQKS
jgi:hypothetical protein